MTGENRRLADALIGAAIDAVDGQSLVRETAGLTHALVEIVQRQADLLDHLAERHGCEHCGFEGGQAFIDAAARVIGTETKRSYGPPHD